MVTDYITSNWALILVLLGFTISLISTVFLEKKVIMRMYALIVEVLLLSIIVFAEFSILELPEYRMIRTILIAVRYSATPFLVAQIIITIVRKQRWFIFIPAIVLTIIDFISIPTGIVFRIDDSNKMQRGPLSLLPYIMVGLYCAFLIYLMIKQNRKQATEKVPIFFFGFAFFSGIIMPFLIGSEYLQLFCETIAIAMFVYYVFSILQVTKKDPLTGLLNRQAYYSDTSSEPEEITALVSLDMNGLKTINDTEGHIAGDKAISTLANCFLRAVKRKQTVYRVGGDEFVIVCRKVPEEEVIELTKRIHKYVDETPYSCSVGYGYSKDGKKSIDELLSESDANMYAEKQQYYEKCGKTRRGT
ncbi:MAG: GGDEF domain-containing protein [Lachnospiraceae bacterium]|nr:GGDEF domain-containing protein [Lachnospiraceae bacterium]